MSSEYSSYATPLTSLTSEQEKISTTFDMNAGDDRMHKRKADEDMEHHNRSPKKPRTVGERTDGMRSFTPLGDSSVMLNLHGRRINATRPSMRPNFALGGVKDRSPDCRRDQTCSKGGMSTDRKADLRMKRNAAQDRNPSSRKTSPSSQLSPRSSSQILKWTDISGQGAPVPLLTEERCKALERAMISALNEAGLKTKPVPRTPSGHMMGDDPLFGEIIQRLYSDKKEQERIARRNNRIHRYGMDVAERLDSQLDTPSDIREDYKSREQQAWEAFHEQRSEDEDEDEGTVDSVDRQGSMSEGRTTPATPNESPTSLKGQREVRLFESETRLSQSADSLHDFQYF